MGPPSLTPPISPTTPVWGLQPPDDDSISAIVDVVTKFLPGLGIKPDSEVLRTKLNNRRIEMDGFLGQLRSGHLSDRPNLQTTELVFEDFRIPEGLSKQCIYLAAVPCLTLDK